MPVKKIAEQIKEVLAAATPFQRQVYKAVLKIPSGRTCSYKWVAVQTGRLKAARAVGNALNRNSLPFRPNRMSGIPCHRVIASDGSLGGFSAGLKLKKQLLALEKQTKTKN